MSCGHCEAAVSSELWEILASNPVDVDLDAMRVTFHGFDLSDAALRAAIEAAGYEAT